MSNRIAYLHIFGYCFWLLLLTSCSVEKQLNRQAKNLLINTPELQSAHVGICIFDDSAKTYLYNYQSDKFFIPSSNTKLFTLFAGLTYLPDSLVAARVAYDNGTVIVQATGDPTFLHPDFTYQPLLKFLQNDDIEVIRINTAFASESFAKGWSWDDFEAPFMAERDPFPMFGNVATIVYEDDSLRTVPPSLLPFVAGQPQYGKPWQVSRELAGHLYTIDTGKGNTTSEKRITMAMNKGLFASRYLGDMLHKTVYTEYSPLSRGNGFAIYSQPKDSLFKMMMHRSDNFFAEQTLLMAANEYVGEMNDAKMIDTLLNTVLKNTPQRPKWVDGSGLSRYNLFTPKDMVFILVNLTANFGFARMQNILPTANEGTLTGLYKGYENRIFAKTGSLNNNTALSGYLLTKQNKRLIFSIMINNYRADAGVVKKEIERFLVGVIERN